MDLTADFKAYQERVTSSLVNVTRTASQISNQDLSFHRSSSEKLSQALDAQNTHLLRLTSKLLKAATRDTNIKPPNLRDEDAVEDNWRGIVDVVDDLLEKADASLDEFTGVLRRQSPALQQDGAQTPPVPVRSTRPINNWSSAIISKPQLLFQREPNNHDTSPFRPLLKSKPHALVPLQDSIVEGEKSFRNPYAHEITQSRLPQATYETSPPIPFTPPNDSQAVFVDTEERVQEMLKELKSAKEIAIDLEHNDRRSYIGLVCLMQISTRDKDWIVDTLKPWRENLQVLNEVFTDPGIIKVFHGSNMDMIWLQRDLGLYIVGLFDTFHACIALQFPGKSLKHLLQRFANFEAQKQYQTADWRIRPLPDELIDYARSDTHYLLHIYDHLRNMLLENSLPTSNLIDHVTEASKLEALQAYERPVYDRQSGLGSLGWYSLLMQRPVRFDSEQFAVFRAIHEWRDQKAREWDEGLQYVMPNAALWAIAENMPMFAGGLHGCCRPVPRVVAENTRELVDLVKKAKYEGRQGPTVGEIIQLNAPKVGFKPRQWRKEREEHKSQFSGLGATLNELNKSGEVSHSSTPPAQVVSTLEAPVAARSEQSGLWGEINAFVAALAKEASVAIDALQSILPMPHLSKSSFIEASTMSELSTLPPKVNASNSDLSVPTPPNDNDQDIFVLKDRSRKRKADNDLETPEPKSTNGELTTDNPFQALNDQQSSETDQAAWQEMKQQKKNEKRAAKEAKKAKAEASAELGVQSTMTPFDYDGAESLLRPNGDQLQFKPNGTTGGGGVKAMNPFAKAMDTGTGAKRSKMGKELAGKSFTFTS